MKRFLYSLTMALVAITAQAQDRTVENRPYTDLRPFHFGVLVGTHLQDIEFATSGLVTYIDENGNEATSNVSVDQDRWDPGFTVGVLGEFRLSKHFQLRVAPSMYFGTRHLTFHNLAPKEGEEHVEDKRQEMKSAYIASSFDLIFAAPRFNNHRPYVMTGLCPMMNLSSYKDDYINLKKGDVCLEIGLGCDFYLPFFKLRPELKFMYGLMNTYDSGHINNIKDKSMSPYTLAAKEAHSKMIALTFYFE